MWWWSNSSLASWDYLWGLQISWNKGIKAVLLTVSKNVNIGMHSDIYKLVWFKLVIQTWCDNGYYLIHFDTDLIGLDLRSRSQECETANISALIISQSSWSIWIEFGILLRLVQVVVGVMNHVLIWFCLFNIQRKEPYLCDLIKKFTCDRPSSFKLFMVTETAKLYLLNIIHFRDRVNRQLPLNYRFWNRNTYKNLRGW